MRSGQRAATVAVWQRRWRADGTWRRPLRLLKYGLCFSAWSLSRQRAACDICASVVTCHPTPDAVVLPGQGSAVVGRGRASGSIMLCYVSSPMIGLLGDNRLAAGTDHGDLPWAAKHGQTASATGLSPRGQHGEQDCARCGLIWTVLRYTRSLPIPRQRLSCSDTFRSKKC